MMYKGAFIISEFPCNFLFYGFGDEIKIKYI